MSLDFSFSKCKTLPDGRNVYDHPNSPDLWNPVAELLATATMTIGMRSITEENHVRFFERLSLYQRVTGEQLRYGDGTKAFITLADVRAFIGMETNASTATEMQWRRHIIEIASRNPVSNHNRPFKTALECVAQQAAKYPVEARQQEE